MQRPYWCFQQNHHCTGSQRAVGIVLQDLLHTLCTPRVNVTSLGNAGHLWSLFTLHLYSRRYCIDQPCRHTWWGGCCRTAVPSVSWHSALVHAHGTPSRVEEYKSSTDCILVASRKQIIRMGAGAPLRSTCLRKRCICTIDTKLPYSVFARLYSAMPTFQAWKIWAARFLWKCSTARPRLWFDILLLTTYCTRTNIHICMSNKHMNQ